MEDNRFDYLKILEAVDKLPFNVGKNTLIDFLQGNADNKSVKKNRLEREELFGVLGLYTKQELGDIIGNLELNGLIEFQGMLSNKFAKVIAISRKGRNELEDPKLYRKKMSYSFKVKETEITEQDKLIFDSFDFFLKPYNQDQKKGIICAKDKILCIAGAGSGKTTVLTKRIEFLTRFRSVDPKKILAITFTRKARTEMAVRLSKSPYCEGVNIETFNSFCEKVLKQNNDLIYKRSFRVISYPEKVRLFNAALKDAAVSPKDAIETYFSFGQMRGKTNDELIKLFMNDCYSILDLYKVNSMSIDELNNVAEDLDTKHKFNVKLVHKICSYIDNFMNKFGLRDYTDQLMHCIDFFRKQKAPEYDHILIDEYQDVNSLQIELMDLLKPKNLFCVGDPRQSIFGWRGSKIQYILNFEDKYSDCEIITLSTNYRSSRQIVDLVNKSLENSRLPDLKHHHEIEADLKLVKFGSEFEEMQFIIMKILDLNLARNEIFVLARTNRQITELGQRLRLKGIKHIVRTEDNRREIEAAKDEITLATVHSIKGLEAEVVFVMGCTGNNFPCKASDHPIVDLVKIEDYDKEEEERRLFYVALSRAKKKLYLTYSGKNHTRFINDKMIEILDNHVIETEVKTNFNKEIKKSDVDLFSKLKMWRREMAGKLEIPPYMIMHDKTLMAIVEQNPLSIDELGEINGIGPAKIQKFGRDIIDIVNS